MVQVIENRAEIECELLKLDDDKVRPGHKQATVAVHNVTSVAAYPNLLGGMVGATIEMIMPQAAVEDMKPGTRLRCLARRVGPNAVFAESCSAIEP